MMSLVLHVDGNIVWPSVRVHYTLGDMGRMDNWEMVNVLRGIYLLQLLIRLVTSMLVIHILVI